MTACCWAAPFNVGLPSGGAARDQVVDYDAFLLGLPRLIVIPSDIILM
jgi:hypothetical protein